MCGRYAASQPPDLYETYAAVAVDPPPPASWNVAPTDPVSAVLVREQRREVRTLRWGLVPSWSKDRRIASTLINARAETVVTKPAFRTSLKWRRCLVPADGWYEWLAGPGKSKQPYFISRPDEPVAFAGLYEVWRDPETREPLRTCTIVTTTAAPDIAFLHDRMPVVLPRDVWDVWLDPEYEDVTALRDLLRPVEGFVAYAVSQSVNSVKNNGPSLVEPAPADGLF